MISRLKIQGFQSHLDTELELSPGVNVFIGDSDSGKSAVIRALQWLVTNRPSGDSFTNAQSKIVSVDIETPTGTASRHRKPKNGYTINGQLLTTIARSVPEELQSVIDLQSINFQGQLLGQYFLVLDTPGEISRYLSTIFGFELVDLLVVSMKRAHQQLQLSIEHAEQHLATVEQEIASLATVEEIGPLVEEAEALVGVLEQGAQHEVALAGLMAQLVQANARRLTLAGVQAIGPLLVEADALVEILGQNARQEQGLADLVTQMTRANARRLTLAGAHDVNLQTAEQTLAQLQQIEAFESGLHVLLSELKQSAIARTSAHTLQTSVMTILEQERQAYVTALGEQCPTCFRPVDAGTRAHVLEELC